MNTRTAGSRPRRDGNTAWQMPCGNDQSGNTGSSSPRRIA
jgi:hypothetical protein